MIQGDVGREDELLVESVIAEVSPSVSGRPQVCGRKFGVKLSYYARLRLDTFSVKESTSTYEDGDVVDVDWLCSFFLDSMMAKIKSSIAAFSSVSVYAALHLFSG